MKKLLFAITIVALCSCGESAQDSMTEAMEDAIERKTGTQIDVPDAEDIEKNAGFVKYKSENKVYLNGKEKMQATAVIQKENDELMISLQLSGENGKSFIASLSHVPENFSLPLKGKFAVSNSYDGTNPVATALFMSLTENGMMNSVMPFEGEMSISKLTEEFIEFEIKAKGGNATDADSPSNWISISGSGKITSPIIMSFGIDKNNVLK